MTRCVDGRGAVGRRPDPRRGTTWLDLPLARRRRLAPLIGARPARSPSTTRRRSTSTSSSSTLGALTSCSGRRGDRHRRRRLPDRPLRRRRHRPRRRGGEVRHGLDRPRRMSTWCCGRWSTTAPPRSPTSPPRPHGPRRPARIDDLGPLARGRCARGRPARARRRAGGRLHLQVPQRRAGRAGVRRTWRRAVHDRIVQPIWGWFAQTDQFAMERPFDPAAGVGRLLNGTPPVLGLTAARERDPPHRRSRHRRGRGEGPRPDRLRPRPRRCERSRHRHAARSGEREAATSPSTIPTLGVCTENCSNARSSSTTATPTCCASDCRR